MLSNETKQIINNLPTILSISEVASFFGVEYLTVYRMVQNKQLAAYKDIESHWCILRSDFLKYCSKNCNL